MKTDGRLILFLIPGLFFLGGCSPSKKINNSLREFESSLKYHLGVSVVESGSRKALVSWQDDRHFNPASNTKIYTLYASLNTPGDSLPGLHYQVVDDTLFFQGTGDPSFLHPDLPESAAFRFLHNSDLPVVYLDGNFSDGRYGPGWAWDDYNDYYQAEKSAFPIFGSQVRFTGDSVSILRTDPSFWNTALRASVNKSGIIRDEHENIFRFSEHPLPVGLRQDIPLVLSDRLTVQLLNYSLKKEVKLRSGRLAEDFNTLHSLPADTVYRMMMFESDNMIAEQLLYTYAAAHGLPLNSEGAINHAMERHFSGLPDSLVWRDGSGLSRYNLFTPRTTVEVLTRMIEKFPKEQVLGLFPKAGKTGTVRYILRDSPIEAYAKSGSFSNNYCLSGYMYSRRGKLLVFSIMNNNFAGPVRDLQRITEQILIEIFQRF